MRRPSSTSGWIARLPAACWRILVNGRAAWIVLLASAALTLIGIYCIDIATAREAMPGQLSDTAVKQALYASAGLSACVVLAIPNYRWYGAASWLLLAIALGLLIFLLLPFVPASIVRARNGARGWIDLGPVDVQPSEFAKIAYVLVLSWYLRYKEHHRELTGLLIPAAITAVPVCLIMLQPDLGSASLFVPCMLAMLLAAGARLQHLVIVVALGLAAAPAAYPFLKAHQRERFVGLFKQLKGDTSADQDINMQAVTAKRLVGAGGAHGAGEERARTLLHFNALPERHNDMVFAVVCNRFGLFGGVVVLLLYVAWIGGSLWTAAVCREDFGKHTCVGLATFVASQVFINVGMNIGLLPIIGITLPYVSHGGSSMLAMWAMTGLIIGVCIRQDPSKRRRAGRA
jgi:rod shape determining protein RodA